MQLDYLLLAATAFHPVVDIWLAERDGNWKAMLLNNGTVFQSEREFCV